MITVIDTSTWINAKVFGWPEEAAITKALTVGVLGGCEQLWREIYWVLTRKYQWPPQLASDDLMLYAFHSINVPIDGSIRGCTDPDDDFILECAVRTKARAIVSNDLKHLVRMSSFECIPILTPEQYLLMPYEVNDEEISLEEARTSARDLSRRGQKGKGD